MHSTTNNSNDTHNIKTFDEAIAELTTLISIDSDFADHMALLAKDNAHKTNKTSVNSSHAYDDSTNISSGKKNDLRNKQERVVQKIDELNNIYDKIQLNAGTLQELSNQFIAAYKARATSSQRNSTMQAETTQSEKMQTHLLNTVTVRYDEPDEKQQKLLNDAKNQFLSPDEIENLPKNWISSTTSILNTIIQKVEGKIDKIATSFSNMRKQQRVKAINIAKTERIDNAREELGPGKVGGHAIDKLMSNIMNGAVNAIIGNGQEVQKTANIKPRQVSSEVNMDELGKKFDHTIQKIHDVGTIINEVKNKMVEQSRTVETSVKLGSLTPPGQKQTKGIQIQRSVR